MSTLAIPKPRSLLNRWRRPRIVEAGASDRSAGAITLVAAWHADVVGRATLEVRDHTAVIHTLYVDPSWCRKGIGRRLLRGLLQRARFQQIRDVYVLATTATAGFYALHGFRPADPQNASLDAEDATELLMRRHLTTGLINIPSAGITVKM